MDVKVIFNDLKLNLSDQYAQQVSLSTIQEESDVISIHTSLNSKSTNLINKNFINKCKKPFWLINTSRGQCLVLEDLIEGLKKGKILGAALDVIEYEKKTFENLLSSKKIMTNFLNLVDLKKIVITPHIAGWTHESKIKMVEVILKKVEKLLK